MEGNFNKDLTIGERVERKIASILIAEHPTIGKIQGKNINYDLVDLDGYSVEVKFDELSKKTGNIAIEYKYKGKPSGISTSKAIDWAIIYFYKKWRYTLIRRTELKQFIKSNFKYFKLVCGGDSNYSRIVLIPIENIENTFVCKDL